MTEKLNPPKHVQEYGINFASSEVYECGATLVSLLAYPHDDEQDTARSNLHGSLCALALRARYEGTPEEIKPQSIKPIHAFRDLRQIDKDLRTLKRRLRDRMVAARMAIAFLKEVETGKPIQLPKGLKKLSINEMSRIVLQDAEQSDPENVETRIWRPSLPVIHLAAATAVEFDVVERHGFRLSIGNLILTRPLIEAIVREAEQYEALLQKSSRLKIDPLTLIKLRLQD